MTEYSSRYGVSISHYGGSSWPLAELQRALSNRGIRMLEIRGSAYPEMTRAEQVRQARISGVETLVFLDSHVEVNVAELEEVVAVAEQHGVCVTSDPESPWALECGAVSRGVLEAVIQAESRRYQNSAVDTMWGGEKVPAVPIASPWNRDGSSLVPGQYLTDGEAFLHRCKASGAHIAQFFPDGMKSARKRMRTRGVNLDMPITDEPGSRFALCIPTFGALDLDQQAAVYALEKVGMTVFGLHDCPWIDKARSWLTERALALGKGVFFLDHDIIFHANDVLRLCQQALERDGVVAGAYCMRKSGKNLIGSFDVPPGPMKFFDGGDTFPAFYSGLGFAAVPRSVLEAIELPTLRSEALGRGVGWGEKVRPWYALDCSTGFYAGEDVSFCNRVHDLRIKMMATTPGFEAQWQMTHSGRPARVFIDSRVRIFHRGSYDYGIEDAGIVVPRIEQLETHMTESRQEAREILINALELPVDVKLDMQEFAHP
jgi:hypothetical protein